MGDRVYPLVDEANLHGDTASSIATNKDEQQKRFQKALQESSYKEPTPFPLQYRRRRRRCNPCCCCLGWICGILVTILILLGVAALVFYLLLHPKAPKFSVTGAHISEFNLTNGPLVQSDASASALHYLQTDMNFTVEAENPNKKIAIYYDEIDVSLYYEGTQIGMGSLPPFSLDHEEATDLQLEMKGQDAPLTEAIATAVQEAVSSGSSIWLQVKTITHARIKIWSWKSGDSKFKVNCDVEISNPAAGRGTRLLSKSCKLKVVKISL